MGAPGTPAWELIRALVKQLNLPGTLRDVKVGPEHFADIARRALVYVNLKDNPRQISRVEEVIEVLELAR
jgi:maleylacetate reductase